MFTWSQVNIYFHRLQVKEVVCNKMQTQVIISQIIREKIIWINVTNQMWKEMNHVTIITRKYKRIMREESKWFMSEETHVKRNRLCRKKIIYSCINESFVLKKTVGETKSKNHAVYLCLYNHAICVFHLRIMRLFICDVIVICL